MKYMEFINSGNFQEFNCMSDFIESKIKRKKYDTLNLKIDAKKIEKITDILNYNNDIIVFLGSFLFLLEKYGRQNTILINLAFAKKMMPFGIKTESNATFTELLNITNEHIDKYIKSSETISEMDNKVNFYFEMDKITNNGILNVNIKKVNNKYVINLSYDSCYFEEDNIKYFLRHYKNILNKIENILDIKLDEIELTDTDEIKLIKNVFNGRYKQINNHITITDIIEFNCKKYCTKKAVILGDEFITYEDLNKKANFLANKLMKHGVKNGDFVVIIPERSIEMVIGIFAILKCGAAYVPVDPKYPDDRIKYIIDTCKPKIIFTVNKNLDFKTNAQIIDISTIEKVDDLDNPIRNQNNDSIAYSIFTSGTTGKPKGVVLRHKGLYNLVMNYKKIYGITENDTLLQFASIAFDQSVWDIFTILGLGGTLCLITNDLINNPRQLEKYMEDNKVSVAALTPAYIKLLNPDNLPTLRVIESGSAAADYTDLQRWLKKRRVFNTYGPTEATVNTLSYEITSLDNRILPIGTPIRNAKIYIVNNNHICGIGEPGELCIAGYGVAKEYLNDSEKTSTAFVNCPFTEGKMYKSGDLVKYRHDGQIIYIGRIDDQIKIRGFRIELGEIENCIRNLDFIKDVYLIVETKKDRENEIDAYVLSNKTINPKVTKKLLSSKLPDYMIPSHIYQVENIPLTINGKVDKTQLRLNRKIDNKIIESPKGKFEEEALLIYKEVLGEENFGVTDDFYEIGGSSIKAISIISRLRELGYTYEVCDLLREKTIRNLGKVKESSCEMKKYISLNNPKYIDIVKEKEKQFETKAINISFLTPTQMYMLEAYRKHIVGDNYLQYFYKCPRNLNFENLEKAINLLAIKNEAVTTAIIDDGKQPIQIRFRSRKIELKIYEQVSNEKYNEICSRDVQRGFDIANDPMLRFKIFKMINGDIKLLFSISHIIADGWSVELLIQDLSQIYIELEKGIRYNDLKENIIPKEKKSLLEECFATINRKEKKETIEYWNKYFKQIGRGKTIPYDHELKNNCKTDNWSIVDWIDEKESLNIIEFCKKQSISENTLFEFAYGCLLAITNNCKSSFFYKVISGRDIPIKNIDNIVGMLINIIPQTIKISNNLNGDLKKLNETLLQNSKYDKFDFYHKMVNSKYLMDEGKTIFVFSNYYELTSSIFEYEFDRDQDEVDMSFFVDSMKNKYHILITGQKNLYSEEKLKKICKLYQKILVRICGEETLDDLYL